VIASTWILNLHNGELHVLFIQRISVWNPARGLQYFRLDRNLAGDPNRLNRLPVSQHFDRQKKIPGMRQGSFRRNLELHRSGGYLGTV